tara:strand:- start:11074 stop:11487 length:414 start_codon:yes stop_codon:yes gene_type:complete
MIIFDLNCLDCNYKFEGWFDSTNDYSKQKKKNYIKCPSCESNNINKALMAPNLNKKSNSKNIKSKRSVSSSITKLKKIIEKNYDYVGDNFTDEAIKMKYGETKERSIYGEATVEQTQKLTEEEIDIVPLPFSSKKTN